jgi:hypothetical protein
MKKSFFKICLIVFLAFWQTASSYIHEAKIYRNAETGQIIITLGDAHILATKQQNFDQLEKFKKIYSLLDSKKIYSRVLFEDIFAYTLDFSFYEKVKCEEITDKWKYTFPYYFPIALDKLDKTYQLDGALLSMTPTHELTNTWIFGPLCFWLLKNKSAFIGCKSIDRRLITTLWKPEVNKEFKKVDHLLNFQNLSLFLERQFADYLSSELKKVLNEIYNSDDQKKFNEKINQISSNATELASYLDEAEAGFEDSVPSRAVNHEAALFLFGDKKGDEKSARVRFLIAGSGHTKKMSQFMERMNFYPVKTFGISFEEFLKSNPELYEKIININLPTSLQQEMNLAFEYIYNLIDQNVYDLPICKEGEVGSGTQNTTSTTSSSNQYPVQLKADPTKKRKIDEDMSVTISQKDDEK